MESHELGRIVELVFKRIDEELGCFTNELAMERLATGSTRSGACTYKRSGMSACGIKPTSKINDVTPAFDRSGQRR